MTKQTDQNDAIDRQLIFRLQQGEREALGLLYERYKDIVYRTALATTHDQRAAEDILQECFIRLYTYAESVDPERPLKPWLYRVTLNLVYDWSAKRRWTQPITELLEWVADLPAAFPAPDRRTEEQEIIHLVREVVAELPPPHRNVIVLFYLEHQSVEDISQILEVPPGTVKSRLYYARERLRETLTRRQRPVPEMTYEFT
jgi:RNA polymerase sigma-70 factor (ECF subfamily)